jgi:hypothetical protein
MTSDGYLFYLQMSLAKSSDGLFGYDSQDDVIPLAKGG